jgi:hypothetical protein
MIGRLRYAGLVLRLKFVGLPCIRPRLPVFLLNRLPNNDPRPAKPAELALRRISFSAILAKHHNGNVQKRTIFQTNITLQSFGKKVRR